MYPKVKVKEQEEDDMWTPDTWPPLEDFDFLSTYDFNSPVSEYEDDSPKSVVRIPDSFVSNPPPLSQGKAKIKYKKHVQTNITIIIPKIRASPVPPPRAILSSPDNDGLMKSINTANSIPRRSIYDNTKILKREPKETREIRQNIKEKRRDGVIDTRQRAHEMKQRPDWV